MCQFVIATKVCQYIAVHQSPAISPRFWPPVAFDGWWLQNGELIGNLILSPWASVWLRNFDHSSPNFSTGSTISKFGLMLDFEALQFRKEARGSQGAMAPNRRLSGCFNTRKTGFVGARSVLWVSNMGSSTSTFFLEKKLTLVASVLPCKILATSL